MGSRRQPFLSDEFLARKEHGGSHSVGRRKVARPIATRRPMHMTLRSSSCRGRLSLHTKAKEIRSLVRSLASRFQVRVSSFSNNGNHLHLLVRARSRGGFKRFLMALSGRIAQLMTGARKGRELGSRFWDHIPFTRIVEWGRDLLNVKRYIRQNILEAAGSIPYQPRNQRNRISLNAKTAISP